MTTSFTESMRAKLAQHYRDVHEWHPDIIERGRKRGYRLATVSDREFLAPRNLYCWRGTVWVKLSEIC